jgi:restriction system protein
MVGRVAQMQREAERRRNAEIREAKRIQRERERAQREHEKQVARDEKDRKRLYLESRGRETEALNRELDEAIKSLEGVLAATLEVDDYIDLDSLKQTYHEPQFSTAGFGAVTAEPEAQVIPALGAFASLMPGAKAKHAVAVAAAEEEHEAVVAEWRTKEATREREIEAAKERHDLQVRAGRADVEEANAKIEEFRGQLDEGHPDAIVDYFGMVLDSSSYPDSFPGGHKLAFVPDSRQLVLEHDLPPFDVIPEAKAFKYVKARDEITVTARPESQRRTLYSSVIAQASLRTVDELFEADRRGLVETIVFNGMVDSIDKKTGLPVRVCVVTLRTTRELFTALDLRRVDPEECLKGLNAGVSRRPSDLAPVRPILEFKMVYDRFVDETDVLSGLDQRQNLMALSPSEFESLITNLFEKMGLETRQTRPSRDGGVDCVAWDTRPVMGGKVVIQAKRYTHTVGVSAVRDLYGTVLNEGASKGILVSTSGYGKASFEFADDKPLELLDGTNLLYLLKEHADIDARIDTPEDWADPDGTPVEVGEANSQ